MTLTGDPPERFLPCGNHSLFFITLPGAPPPPLMHPLVAIVQDNRYLLMKNFSMTVIQKHRAAPTAAGRGRAGVRG